MMGGGGGGGVETSYMKMLRDCRFFGLTGCLSERKPIVLPIMVFIAEG